MRESINYQQLNMLSSIVLYNERKKRKTGKLYEAERIIERRNKGRVRTILASLSEHLCENIFASYNIVIKHKYTSIN